ncbi:MAG: NAD-dependent epimerase/dehydratase family protein [Magnetococcales bacterium]|nr:NAD-dependent epimerase/dehydratase family protein [Magnetococcales bacterium]
MKRILVTGGAGFVGSNLAVFFKRDQQDCEVVAFDNLRRRGSEITLARLRTSGVVFVHGDVRTPEDLANLGAFDWLIECSAEPSVHAGYGSSPGYLINTNLMGAVNCLEHQRRHGGGFLFLSTSRVYPVGSLCALPLEEEGKRFTLKKSGRGWSALGIAEEFDLAGSRSLYGATKLCSEQIAIEYGEAYGMPVIINRCGVLSGPWQMGKVDQGFMALWVARHFFGGTLNYMGFGGRGIQVRDVLHVADLYHLLRLQMRDPVRYEGTAFNVGGGVSGCVSLLELTEMCEAVTGNRLDIGADPTTRAVDIPYYVSDNTRIEAISGWRPRLSVEAIVDDLYAWLLEHKAQLVDVFAQ